MPNPLLLAMPAVALVVLLLLYLVLAVRILREDERGVLFRLGRLMPGVKGPGLVLILPLLDRLVRVSLAVETIETPYAVISYRVGDPRKAVLEVADHRAAISQIARNLGRSVTAEALAQHIAAWGIEVVAVKPART